MMSPSVLFFFFNDTATTEIYTLSLHDALPITVRGYGALFRDRAYVGLVVVVGLTMAGLLSYVSGSPFVYQEQFGLDEQQFGLLFGAGAIWLIAATQLNPVLLRRWSPADRKSV